MFVTQKNCVICALWRDQTTMGLVTHIIWSVDNTVKERA